MPPELYDSRSDTYGGSSAAGVKGNDIIDGFVLGYPRAKRSRRATTWHSQLELTTSTTTRRQRRVRTGLRLFGFGKDALEFAAASSLGCRATHIPLSAPRFAISSSPPQRYYVLQSRTIVLSIYQLSIRFTSHLPHLPFSTLQVGRLLPSCSEYLAENVESRYTTLVCRPRIGSVTKQVIILCFL